MSSFRVALLEMRPRLADILADAVTRQPNIALVARNLKSDASLADLRPDVVVCEAANALDPKRPKALLEVLPRSRVLMVARSGRQAVLFELRTARLVLREVSMSDVVNTLSTAIRVDAARWEPVPDERPRARSMTSRLADLHDELARRQAPPKPVGRPNAVTRRERP